MTNINTPSFQTLCLDNQTFSYFSWMVRHQQEIWLICQQHLLNSW